MNKTFVSAMKYINKASDVVTPILTLIEAVQFVYTIANAKKEEEETKAFITTAIRAEVAKEVTNYTDNRMQELIEKEVARVAFSDENEKTKVFLVNADKTAETIQSKIDDYIKLKSSDVIEKTVDESVKKHMAFLIAENNRRKK